MGAAQGQRDDVVLSGGEGESGCDEAVSSARTLPVVLLVLGAAALVGSPFVERRESVPVGS